MRSYASSFPAFAVPAVTSAVAAVNSAALAGLVAPGSPDGAAGLVPTFVVPVGEEPPVGPIGAGAPAVGAAPRGRAAEASPPTG